MLFNLFSASLQEYEEQTGIALSKHPLQELLRDSDSSEFVTAILQEQLPACSESGGSYRITKSLGSIISVLYTLSVSLDLNLPLSVEKPIYAGFAILLTAIKDVSKLDQPVDLLMSIESLMKHLDIYTKSPQTYAMTETVVKILMELLSILGLATKLIKQRRPGTSLMKLLRGNFDQMVLERLDRLTLDEGRITALQTLKIVYGLIQNMRVVMDSGKPSIDDILDALKVVHHIVSDANKSKRDKLKQDVRSWLLPPNPSMNHKIACELRHTGTTAWFVQGDTFSEWKWSKTSSLLWIHGKPGAGKTVLCSAIIQDIFTMRRAGLVSLAYYFFDFRDDRKKDLRGLISSLLVQLCHQSDSYCNIISKFYSEHTKASRCPSDAALLLCLKGLLELAGQAPIYLIVDALDECSTTSDMPPTREKVLMFVKQLMTSNYPNLRVCVTSRLEPYLSVALEPLSSRTISLHDERGHKEDIASYIKSVVHTDPKMQAWKAGNKKLVISVLTHKVDGIFQWASCQFAHIRHCSQKRIQRALKDLPETLDGTYLRTLRDIDKADRASAHRLFSCISVARRPLRAEELAELLAFNFEGGPFRLSRRGWCQEDMVNAVQTTYSSFLATPKDGKTTIIQFSHFLVQEFFKNGILANASADVAYYHVPMTPTHTLVAQACLDVLLRLDENVVTRDSLRGFPLAKYAAEHWLDHARFGDVWQIVEDKVKCLFDPRKPHFAACLWINDAISTRTERAERPSPLTGTALHYAAFWGLHNIVKFLVIERSQDVHAPGFTNMVTPLHLAAKRGHVEVARSLLECGANVTARDKDMETPLHLAGQVEVARLLIDYGANVHSEDMNRLTPLHLALRDGHLEVARFLIDHGADVNARDVNGFKPLHLASREGQLKIARFVFDCSADANIRDMNKLTPLHLALQVGQLTSAHFLIDYGADVDARDMDGLTPLHLASREGQLEVARLLVDHGANVNPTDKNNSTPLHLASREGQLEVTRFLIDHGADMHARDVNRLTPLHLVSQEGQLEVAGFLIDRGAYMAARDRNGLTPLHLASQEGQLEVAHFLIDHSAYVNAWDMNGLTPLHLASREGQLEVARFLINHGADIHAQDVSRLTPLHLALRVGRLTSARLLIDYGADVDARDMDGLTPLHLASREGQLEVARFLVDRGANLRARDIYRSTPLHLASREGQREIAHILLERGADSDARDNDDCIPLHRTAQFGHLEVVRVLLEHGTNVNSRDIGKWTPLHGASQDGHSEVVHFLLNHGANVHASDLGGWTSLQLASLKGDLRTVGLLLEHGADANTRDNSNWTPLHCASRWGHQDAVQVLLMHGADANARDNNNWTPLHFASQQVHREVVSVLLEYLADVNPRGDRNQTPLHLASREGCLEIVELLIESRADLDVRNDEGRTPFEEASAKGHRNIMWILSWHKARNEGA